MRRLSEVVRQGPSHVVIAMINGIGDGVLALPLIRYVMRMVGPTNITVWALPKYSRTCFSELGHILLPMITEDRDNASFKELEVSAVRDRVRDDQVLCWVSLNAYHPLTINEAHVVAQLNPKYMWTFNDCGIRRDTEGRLVHRADSYFRVIGEPVSSAGLDRRPTIDACRDPMLRHFRRTSAAAGKVLIAVHAETAEKKQWPTAYWLQLGDLLAKQCQLLVLGGPQPRLVAHPAFVQARAVWSWDEQVAILAHADGFVGIDSCFAHVADACDVDGVVLYGSENPTIEAWLPRNGRLTPLFGPGGDLTRLEPDVVAEFLRAKCFNRRAELMPGHRGFATFGQA